MRVCYFGPFDPEYPRNRVIIKGLRRNGVDVTECNSRSANRLFDYAKLLRDYRSLDCDVVILGARGDYYGQPLVPIMKRMTNKPVVFDAVLTLYETQVIDRALVSRNSMTSRLLYFLDNASLRSADLVLSDTVAHANYYSHFYGIELEKAKRVFIGSDDEVFFPRELAEKKNSTMVIFWGGFIPLQGVQYIIQAAKILESCSNLAFELRGFGQTYESAYNLWKNIRPSNLTFDPTWIPYNQLPEYIAGADICLGIFGGTEKAKRVIPNKVVEALAMKKPLITGDSIAAREVLEDKENCVLVPMADPKALAEAILMLEQDNKLRDKISERGYRLFMEKFSPDAIGKELKSVLHDLIEDSHNYGGH